MNVSSFFWLYYLIRNLTRKKSNQKKKYARAQDKSVSLKRKGQI